VERRDPHDGVPVDEMPVPVGGDDAIPVSVVRESEVGPVGDDRSLDDLRMG